MFRFKALDKEFGYFIARYDSFFCNKTQHNLAKRAAIATQALLYPRLAIRVFTNHTWYIEKLICPLFLCGLPSPTIVSPLWHLQDLTSIANSARLTLQDGI